MIQTRSRRSRRPARRATIRGDLRTRQLSLLLLYLPSNEVCLTLTLHVPNRWIRVGGHLTIHLHVDNGPPYGIATDILLCSS